MLSARTQEIPEDFRADLEAARRILTDFGCSEAYLFGSLATGKPSPTSDIDLAIRGCPGGKFFKLLGRLTAELDHPVDLVNLDHRDLFSRFLEDHGELRTLG